jgi:hypothetical protein
MSKVLVACEFSGRVREAFRKRGHDAVSCDLLPTEIPGPHYQGDIYDLLEEDWDLVVGFPPCQDLSWAAGKLIHEKRADGRAAAAAKFATDILLAGKHAAIENVRGDLWHILRRPDQIIHPYNFGEPYLKMTCLWLRGVPPLLVSETDEPPDCQYWISVGNARGQQRRLGIGMHRRVDTRQRTFQSIADAMADQWGAFISSSV